MGWRHDGGMMITREAIEQRLAALKQDLQALALRTGAVQGAILDCEFWLTQLATPEPKPEPGADIVSLPQR